MDTKRMLVATGSGFVADEYLGLRWIERGVTRIAPEILEEREEYREYFDPGVSVRGTDSTRAVVRSTTPEGRVVADERF